MTERLEPKEITGSVHGKYHFLGVKYDKKDDSKKKVIKVCKYMNLKNAESCIENQSLWFASPSSWMDPYERIFHKGNFSEAGFKLTTTPSHVLATCFTPTTSCEASWKVYLYGKDQGKEGLCVQFVFDFEKLRNELAEQMPQEKEIYEGRVIYKTTRTINTLRTKGSEIFNRFFKNPSIGLETYLSLLLIKRPAFQYEDEIRLFLIGLHKDDYYSFKCDLSKCIDHIVVDENITELQLMEFKNLCKRHKIKEGKIKTHNLYIYDENEPLFLNNKNSKK